MHTTAWNFKQKLISSRKFKSFKCTRVVTETITQLLFAMFVAGQWKWTLLSWSNGCVRGACQRFLSHQPQLRVRLHTDLICTLINRCKFEIRSTLRLSCTLTFSLQKTLGRTWNWRFTRRFNGLGNRGATAVAEGLRHTPKLRGILLWWVSFFRFVIQLNYHKAPI